MPRDQMKGMRYILLCFVALAGLAHAQNSPIRIILIGDSTVAPKNGWGPGFCALTSPDVTCINEAKNGRS
jgi:hypothetical protein